MAFFDLLDCIGVVISEKPSEPLLMRMSYETYDVTGISPQSRTVAQLLKGLASRGTL